MALSNKFGTDPDDANVRANTTATALYGDMAGGFAVIKDVVKRACSRWRRGAMRTTRWRRRTRFPERITRPPRPSCGPDQTDQDQACRPYEVLDAIVPTLHGKRPPRRRHRGAGFAGRRGAGGAAGSASTNTKRQQAAVGTRVTPQLGKDWRCR